MALVKNTVQHAFFANSIFACWTVFLFDSGGSNAVPLEFS